MFILHSERTKMSINILLKITTSLIVGILLCIPSFVFSQNDIYEQEILFIPEGGFYNAEVKVKLYHKDEASKIYYTLDGSEPNHESTLYERPIRVKNSQVVRAIAYHDKDPVCRMETSTYFINEPETEWPVVSMAIAPEMLFDSVKGIFQLGVENELEGLANYGANYWDRREHFMNLEIFEKDSSCVYRSPCGFRLFGGMSRTFPQKSIAVVSRLRYGNKRFKNKFFENSKLKRYKHLIFRNAGSDWNRAHGRDAIINSMVDDWGLDKQSYQPCHVYLNAEYWGVYYIREKINTYFIASHHRGIHPDSIDLIEHRWALRKGSKSSYTEMLEFIEHSDMSSKKNYTFLKTLMNVENYADYKLLEIFIDNADAGGNIKFWRTDNYDNGRWQWILYDTDWGFGLMKHDAYKHNSLNFHTEANGPDWPNPPWSTLILRKLLENREFRHLFINRFCDRMNTSFRTDSMLSKIETHYNLMRPEMDRQFDRWDSNERIWTIHYNRMINFAEKRPEFMWEHLKEKFNTGERVGLSVTAEGRGRVMINHNIKASYQKPFQGNYLENIPITIQAQPRLGYKFSHWEGTSDPTPTLKINLKGKKQVDYKAVFIPLNTVLMDSIIFNEVSVYNKRTGDWMELHNTTRNNINIEGWIIKNQKKEFRLPKYWLGPNDYVVVAKDTSRFLEVFPMYSNRVIGDFDFGLDRKSDKLELYTRKGATVDTFSYNIKTPGSDFTIDLKAPHLDNGDSTSWEVNYGSGTPADINPSYLASLTRQEQIRWIIIGLLAGLLLVGLFVYSAIRD